MYYGYTQPNYFGPDPYGVHYGGVRLNEPRMMPQAYADPMNPFPSAQGQKGPYFDPEILKTPVTYKDMVKKNIGGYTNNLKSAMPGQVLPTDDEEIDGILGNFRTPRINPPQNAQIQQPGNINPTAMAKGLNKMFGGGQTGDIQAGDFQWGDGTDVAGSMGNDSSWTDQLFGGDTSWFGGTFGGGGNEAVAGTYGVSGGDSLGADFGGVGQGTAGADAGSASSSASGGQPWLAYANIGKDLFDDDNPDSQKITGNTYSDAVARAVMAYYTAGLSELFYGMI